MAKALDEWHRIVRERDPDGLDDLLADDVVFHSPVVHTPQRGKPITAMYLAAAVIVLGQPSGIEVNGVDLIRWNDQGRIVDFKVMVRPLKAINLIHQKMAAVLQAGG